jgi:hypothetical protein
VTRLPRPSLNCLSLFRLTVVITALAGGPFVSVSAFAESGLSGPVDQAPLLITQTIRNGATLSGSIAWFAFPSSASVTKVEFLIDGALFHTERAPPYGAPCDTCSFDTTNLGNGTHVLAVATLDTNGNSVGTSATVTIRNEVPLTIAQSIRDGDLLTGSVDWFAVPSRETVSEVEFLIDGVPYHTELTSPFGAPCDTCSFDTSTLANGPHVFEVVTVDSTGDSASTSATVTINNAPACSRLAWPGSGTAQALLASLSSGETGCLRGGSYSASGPYVLDFAKPGVSIISYPGERAVLHGIVVARSGASKVELANVTVDGDGSQNTIQVYAADFTLAGSDVTNSWRGRSCMMLGESSAGTAIRPVIRGNRFHECGNPANGNKDHAIYANQVVDGLITENVFWNSAAYAIQLYPNAQNTVFSHNVVDGGGSVRGGVIFGSESSGVPSSGNTVANNIITYAATYNLESYWGGTPGTGNSARSNCLYGGALGNIGTTSGYSSQNNTSADPQFVNRTAHDYRLKTGSDCLAVVEYDTAARNT